MSPDFHTAPVASQSFKYKTATGRKAQLELEFSRVIARGSISFIMEHVELTPDFSLYLGDY
jgi:hypothetical protein